MKIGVMAELLRKPFLETIDYAAQIGVAGIQIGVTHGPGEINLSACTTTELDLLQARCSRNHLEISAICGDLGGSFQVTAEVPERVELMKKIINSASALGVQVITTHIGHIPEWRDDPTYHQMVSSVGQVARYAEKHGCILAIETGPELADVLRCFIEDVAVPASVSIWILPICVESVAKIQSMRWNAWNRTSSTLMQRMPSICIREAQPDFMD